uniref:Uncharacterized protein n=1 Tax=Arundo donax TaxID=35708 RepID=A0A0A8YC71_ARUDO
MAMARFPRVAPLDLHPAHRYPRPASSPSPSFQIHHRLPPHIGGARWPLVLL